MSAEPRGDAAEVIDSIYREFLRPPPRVAPGAELPHLVREVDQLRLEVKALGLLVEALVRRL